MASKVVYVSPKHHGDYENITVISPKNLDALLEQGWSIIKRKTVKVHIDTKDVSVESLQLATESADRGLSVRSDEESPVSRAVSPFVTQRGEQRGGEISVIGENREGYLGSSIAKHIPGVRIISGMMTHAAFGLGADQAKAGVSDAENPFPAGSKPFSEWYQGFFAADGKVSTIARTAQAEGKEAAHGDKDDEVSCRYAPGTLAYEAWLWSFKKHGGRVES